MELQFSDQDNYAGLIQGVERKLFSSDYGKVSGNTKLLKEFTVRLNNGLTWFTNKIYQYDTRWQHRDSNFTTHGIFTETMIDDQHDYTLDVEHLKIQALEVKNVDGDWVKLDPIDRADVNQPVDEIFNTKGVPRYYDKNGSSLFVYPAPDSTKVTLTEGLRMHAQTLPSYFISTDTTKKPGIPATFHQGIVDYACFEYAEDNQLSEKRESFRVALDANTGWEAKVAAHYSRRDVDDKPVMKPGASRTLSRLI